MKKIALIPIDNRPICYDLIKDILSIDKSIKLLMPDIKHLGGLTNSANVDKIFEFIEKIDFVDYLIVSLDTLAYGGLVSSRRCSESYDFIKNRIEKFKNIVSKKAKKILAFSSVMRISNNNINEEEKEYWNKYGKMIFDWSFNSHKFNKKIKNEIPVEILKDYINTRKRNFKINKIYLKWAKEGFFDTLIFSKDDCAEFGLNVQEAQELDSIIKKNNIKSAQIKTGADEIPLSLISRALAKNQNIKINTIYQESKSIDFVSRYEDISIKNCLEAQIKLANCKINFKNYDLSLLINNFKKEQGDLVLGDVVNNIKKKIIFPTTPYFIADVNNANGSDDLLIKQFIKKNSLDEFYGYCGYNTSANTLGCVILIAIVKFLSIKNKTYNKNAFKKVIFIRLLDDWVYQTIIRKSVREANPKYTEMLESKEKELNEYAKEISKFLDFKYKKISYSLPWDRSFEIRIKIN